MEINKLVFFSDNHSFHTIIYRGKQFFCQTFFCKTNFVALVTEHWLIVINVLVSQRILIKASPILLLGINCMIFKFILCLKDKLVDIPSLSLNELCKRSF